MRKLIAVALALCMCLALCACGDKEETATVKIGVLEPESGDCAAGGRREELGIEFANSLCPTVDIDGRVFNVELVYAECGTDVESAAEAAQTLLDEGVSLVLGSHSPEQSIAASPVFEEEDVACIGVGCIDNAVTEGNSHYFRVCHLNSGEGRALATYARESLGAVKAYCLNILNDNYSTNLVSQFVSEFEAAGGETVAESCTEDMLGDFSQFVLNAVENECGVFFAPLPDNCAARLIEQAEKGGLNMPILSGDRWENNVVLNAVRDKQIDLSVAAFYPEGGDTEFERDFKEWLNAEDARIRKNGGDDIISSVSVMGYDAYFFALEALKNAGRTEAEHVKSAIWNTVSSGVSGQIAVGQVNGDAVRNAVYMKHANTSAGIWDNLLPVVMD